MPSPAPKRRRHRLFFVIPIAIFLLLYCTNYVLQTAWAHRAPPFAPDYPQMDLAPILTQDALTDVDYNTIFLQTGLARPAIDQLLVFGQGGRSQILETQHSFFTAYNISCAIMLPGRFTCEDLVLSPLGDPIASVPLALLEPGDIILSFSTHTFGWRHGHAGVVVDAANGVTIEAVVMGSDSAQINVQHWPNYSNFMVLRAKDATPKERQQVAAFARSHLDGIPYNLISGIFGAKAPDSEGALSAQCAYLPWYAWQEFGYDLDSDGGRIVTVADLAGSPLLELVQVYGMDPRGF